MATAPHKVFITGGTGYMGSRLIPLLQERGHAVTALVRPGSESKAPPGCRVITGDALDPASLKSALGDCDTWVQLIGTPNPAPWKAARFRAVDLRAVTASLPALPGSSIRHYIYLSVAHPAPVMRAYTQVRMEAEAGLRASGIPATFLRPWYVLGPGHSWPHALRPLYRILELLPPTREGALRMGLVTLDQMLRALTAAVESPSSTVRILAVPDIRRSMA